MENKVAKRQKQDIAVTNQDSAKPAKPFNTDKYKNRMELKKLKRKNYFTKEIL